MTSDIRTQMPPDAARITRAWQDGAQAFVTGYGEQVRRIAELTTSFWQPRTVDREALQETIERISQGTREVTNAQLAVAGEWLRAALWLTGAASPVDLQARYVQLFEAQRELVRVYIDAALNWQRGTTATAERVAEVTNEAIDAQTRTARQVANDVREVQESTIDATRTAASTVREVAGRTVEQAREVAGRAVEQAREVAREAAEQAERAQEQAERERQRQERATAREQAERQREQTATRLIKGNVNRDGEKIYHLPGQAGYERVEAEETFATEDEAQAAGYRRSEARGGGTIKGKINREGDRIYHLPGQANYDRLEADMLFETEEQAQANGFRPAQR